MTRKSYINCHVCQTVDLIGQNRTVNQQTTRQANLAEKFSSPFVSTSDDGDLHISYPLALSHYDPTYEYSGMSSLLICFYNFNPSIMDSRYVFTFVDGRNGENFARNIVFINYFICNIMLLPLRIYGLDVFQF